MWEIQGCGFGSVGPLFVGRGFGDRVSRLRVQGSGFEVRVEDLGFKVWGLGGLGLGLRI